MNFPSDPKDKNYTKDLLAKISLSQFSEDSNKPEELDLVLDENFEFFQSTENTTVTFVGLRPGRRYITSLSLDKHVRFPIVPSCSCESLTNEDQTGRPKGLRITQERGHVLFNFIDNSKCESGFSFSRFEGFAEFVDDSKHATSFTNDFSYQAPQQCDSVISPEFEASDDLKRSRLPVGATYSYCVRAVREGNYMDLTVNKKEVRSLASSAAICESHQIAWESSISGLISTEPNAGTIPIPNVHVRWELLSEEGQKLQCKNCFGETKTDEGGIFEINLNIQNEPLLYGANDADIPIRIYFSKTTISNGTEIHHRFLCNEGQDICDNEKGHTTYIKHLHFDTPMHIYDDTSVPFTGKLTIHGTQCPLFEAKACPLHKSVSAENQEELVGNLCVDTDSNGFFSAPVVIGSVIYGVRFEYYEHDFEKTFENKWNYDKGVKIEENGFYAKNDFYDVTKARLIVQGKCDDKFCALFFTLLLT